MLINSGFPFVPTAAHPLTEMMNALIAAYALTHMHTRTHKYTHTESALQIQHVQ